MEIIRELDFPWIFRGFPEHLPLEHDSWPGVEWFGTSSVRLFRGNDAVNGVELEDGEAGFCTM